MNTILIVPTSAKASSIPIFRSRNGVAYFLNPGSLHGTGEVYMYLAEGLIVPKPKTGNLPSSLKMKQKDGADLIAIADALPPQYNYESTDLILPRGIEDELHQLAREYVVFFVRTPAIGLGSHRFLIDPATMFPITGATSTQSRETKKKKP